MNANSEPHGLGEDIKKLLSSGQLAVYMCVLAGSVLVFEIALIAMGTKPSLNMLLASAAAFIFKDAVAVVFGEVIHIMWTSETLLALYKKYGRLYVSTSAFVYVWFFLGYFYTTMHHDMGLTEMVLLATLTWGAWTVLYGWYLVFKYVQHVRHERNIIS